jgi:hypothetical protein
MPFPKHPPSCLITTTAYAHVTKASTFGAWDALQGTGHATDAICAMMASGPNWIAVIRNVHPNKHLTIVISKTASALPQNGKARLRIRIGGETFNGVTSGLDRRTIRIRINNNSLDESFLRHFKAASEMYIIFASRKESPWSANLRGGNEAIASMKHCILHYDYPVAAPHSTEPVAPPSQPYPKIIQSRHISRSWMVSEESEFLLPTRREDMPILKTSALMIGACLISTAANASLRHVSTFGAWRASEGTGDAGDAICAIMVQGKDRAVIIRNVHPNRHLTIEVQKLSWHLPPMSKARLVIKLGNSDYVGVATVLKTDTIRMRINNNSLVDFAHDFEAASKMYIIFKSGNEPAWKANLDGSNFAMPWLINCIGKYDHPVATPHPTTPTQPTEPVSPRQKPNSLYKSIMDVNQ